MIRVFVGYDERESLTYHVLTQSIINTTTTPVSITPLHGPMLEGFDGQQDGTNRFIYSRFLVPELMDWNGWAIYMDSDMLVRTDLTKLWSMRDDSKAVMVAKHSYETHYTKKLIGTPLECRNEPYPRKNWSSLIMWNCGHERNKILTREYVAEAGGRLLHRFSWLSDELIGSLPISWNHLVTELQFNPSAELVHFTLGAPGFSHYEDSDYSAEWNDAYLDVNHMIGEA